MSLSGVIINMIPIGTTPSAACCKFELLFGGSNGHRKLLTTLFAVGESDDGATQLRRLTVQ